MTEPACATLTPHEHTAGAVNAVHDSGRIVDSWQVTRCQACGTTYTAPVVLADPPKRNEIVRTKSGTPYLATSQGWRRLKEQPAQKQEQTQ